ncbi:MAG: DUF6754 domain-containing protein [Chloroflexota bacterium]
MTLLAKNQSTTFILELLFCIGLLLMISRARAGKKVPEIRKVNGLDALDEAIGRATEMGRPVHYSPGIGDLSNSQTLASFSLLAYVARMCAKYDTRLIVTSRTVTVTPVMEEIVKAAYTDMNKADNYNPNDVRFLSDDQFGYASGCVGIMQREQVAANILFGAFWAESLIFAEVGSQSGAIQISGTANTAQIPFFVAACDYTLLGEEMYAASAYLSRDPVLVGNLVGQDWGKWFAAAVIAVGAILATINPKSNPLSTWLLK